jgi:hypothetical protein
MAAGWLSAVWLGRAGACLSYLFVPVLPDTFHLGYTRQCHVRSWAIILERRLGALSKDDFGGAGGMISCFPSRLGYLSPFYLFLVIEPRLTPVSREGYVDKIDARKIKN